MLIISAVTQRRFLMGLHGLYPGRRWQGKGGIKTAIRAMGGLQVDPLNVIARNHDIMLWGRIQNYQMADLDTLLYTERQFFDWGGVVCIYPIEELPHWRIVMERRKQTGRYLKFIAGHESVLYEVLDQIRERGPLGSKDFTGKMGVHTTGFRTDKDTGQALYHLWLTGKLMTHNRRGFQRVYDLLERVAPPELQHSSSVEEAEAFFARQVWIEYGRVNLRGWRTVFQGKIERPVSKAEATDRLESMERAGAIVQIQVEAQKDPYYILTEHLPLLEAVHQGKIPDEWQPLATSTADEVVFLAPLDMVSARGRAKVLFDFEYIWEVYKPADKRRWGYYTLPILYQDRLVARLDPKLDRATGTLQIKGLWLESHIRLEDAAFTQAMRRGLANFASFVGAQQIDVSALTALRTWAESLI